MTKLCTLLLILLISSCQGDNLATGTRQINWEGRQAAKGSYETLYQGKSYLSVYSHIYNAQIGKPYYLTATVSLRNISSKHPVFILKADYYNSDGVLIQEYLKEPIILNPLETVEIVISESDTKGGSGANFLFHWAAKDERIQPLFEAIMISTHSQQGLSFLSKGVQVYE